MTIIKPTNDPQPKQGPPRSVAGLAQLVLHMRQAQRRYFKERDNRLLERAKLLEWEVDIAVNQILNPTLF